jgi:hypothetical protein
MKPFLGAIAGKKVDDRAVLLFDVRPLFQKRKRQAGAARSLVK